MLFIHHQLRLLAEQTVSVSASAGRCLLVEMTCTICKPLKTVEKAVVGVLGLFYFKREGVMEVGAFLVSAG